MFRIWPLFALGCAVEDLGKDLPRADDPRADGGSISPYDGRYWGTVNGQITWQATTSGPIQTFLCTGTVDLVVHGEIDGTGKCATDAGALFDVTIEGDAAPGPEVHGDLSVQTLDFGFEDQWDGLFAGDNLSGAASGTDGESRTWTVDFSVDATAI